jgi:hypothetical protein
MNAKLWRYTKCTQCHLDAITVVLGGTLLTAAACCCQTILRIKPASHSEALAAARARLRLQVSCLPVQTLAGG